MEETRTMSVYMIGSPIKGEPVKIGTAKNVQKRLRQLQTGSSKKLVIIWEMNGGVEEERMLHTYYKKNRINGEWFQLDPEQLNSVVEIFGGFSHIGENYWLICGNPECQEEWCNASH